MKYILIIVLLFGTIGLKSQTIKYNGIATVKTKYNVDAALVQIAQWSNYWNNWVEVDYVEYNNETIQYKKEVNIPMVKITVILWKDNKMTWKERIYYMVNEKHYLNYGFNKEN